MAGGLPARQGYGTFSYSHSHIDNVVKYIMNQEQHHKKRTFREEYIDLLKKFKQDGILIPVIVVTAFDEPQSRACCREYGVKEYLRKPVDGEDLVEIIHKTIEN